MRSGLLPSDLILGDGLIPTDFAVRLDAFKEATGLSWDILAACLGVDPRQLQRWRRGTRPSGDGLCALVQLAARIPGGVHMLLGDPRHPARRRVPASPDRPTRYVPERPVGPDRGGAEKGPPARRVRLPVRLPRAAGPVQGGERAELEDVGPSPGRKALPALALARERRGARLRTSLPAADHLRGNGTSGRDADVPGARPSRRPGP